MLSILKKHPFAVYGVLVLVLYTPIDLLNTQFDIESDSVLAVVVLSLPIWGAVYWVPNELLSSFNEGGRFEGQFSLSVAIGFSSSSEIAA